MAYEVTSGKISEPEKVVVYGPEGIGKSTFASKFPDPLFIDTEGGTKKLDVRRLPQPTSWAMLMDEVNEVRLGHVPCGTLVIDTADWAERLCIQSICDKRKVGGIEDFGYGKGYTYVKEEFGKLLDLLEDVLKQGHNVVVTAHAQISKFELPDEMGQFDRWSMKTSKQVAPLLREWCGMLLFANYKTLVVHDEKTKSNKAQGGKRVMYTTHNSCWDAKNRDDLPEELPFDFASIADVIPYTASHPQVERQAEPPAAKAVENAPAAEEKKSSNSLETELAEAEVPENLRRLMLAANISPKELQSLVGKKGYFPADMPIRDYPKDFVDGCLVARWSDKEDGVYKQLLDYLDLPF